MAKKKTETSEPKEPKSLQCVEFNNLYVDNLDNRNRVYSIINILKSKTDSLAYAYIFHDKDVYDCDTFDSNFRLLGHKGDLKKPHYHIYVNFNSSMPIDRFEETFDLKSSDYNIFAPKHWDNKLLYLTHILHNDKYQYPFDSIQSNVIQYVQSVYDIRLSDRYVDIVPYVVDYVNTYSLDTFISLSELIPNLLNKGYEQKEIRSSIYLINSLVNEHNRFAVQSENFIVDKTLRLLNENALLTEKLKEMSDKFKPVKIDEDTYLDIISQGDKDGN